MEFAPREEILTKWLAALRSGTYQQGNGYLRTTRNSYCCLGVLCEVAGLKAEKRFDDSTIYAYDGGATATLPPRLFEHMRFRGQLGEASQAIPYNHQLYCSLAAMNDAGHLPFEAIADLIEQYPDRIFKDVPAPAVPSMLSGDAPDDV
jgi:hypothetical protein